MDVLAVVGLFLGNGGVPKSPVDFAEVTSAGLVGDRQKVRRIHGGPTRALCLWSAEVLQELIDEGHPLFPGACGENILVAGIDWTTLNTGARLTLGPVTAELTEATTPCRKIRPYFAGGAVRRVDHIQYPGYGRWYASVVTPGTINIGDPVVWEGPAHPQARPGLFMNSTHLR